jgi:hypothetical protein
VSAKSGGTTLARLVLLFRLISAALFVAIAVTHFGSRPAWAETKDDWSLPPTAAGLVEKGAPPEKGKSAPISLRPCKCPDECGKEWQALKDAMDSWYVLQAAAAHRAAVQTFKEEHDAWQGLENDANSFVGAGGAGRNSEAEKAHKARVKANADYGDRDKLRKKIEELAKALVKCENDKCPVPPNVKFELPPCFDTPEQKQEKSEQLKKWVFVESSGLV